nr:hypothetical protein [uncultured Mediterranean phage uvMED]BAR26472.1 hypothetical protein [uncultured Mediterranean phage uvMED]
MTNKEKLKYLQNQKAGLQKAYWFEHMDQDEYLRRYDALNKLIKPLEFEETFGKNYEKK